jgi:putative N6-adenine-specific DNA methylase
MTSLNLIATTAFGIESVVKFELKKLGITDTTVENGRIHFKGDYTTLAKCNLWLRSADRVLIKIASFKAKDFEELFQGTLAVHWGDIIPKNGFMHVIGKSVNSKLHSVPACQSTVKKAIIEVMKRKYPNETFSEDGAEYRIEIAMLNDEATITIDTSGAGLHKRGYRQAQGEAPLKETLAAALIDMSRWKTNRTFVDPLCGSGTIPIEAALRAKNLAPGLNRAFAAEDWQEIPQKIWTDLRDEAKSLINNEPFEIFASDIDSRVLKIATENARLAGVNDVITFERLNVRDFKSSDKYGCIVCNPPYGERMENRELDNPYGESTEQNKELNRLYKNMGEAFLALDSWSLFILNSNEDFQKNFGKQSDKNRKLFNGGIKSYLYQYLGPMPK